MKEGIAAEALGHRASNSPRFVTRIPSEPNRCCRCARRAPMRPVVGVKGASMSARMFSKIDVAEAVRDLPRLLERVAAGTGRVEVAAAGQSVVLISRQ